MDPILFAITAAVLCSIISPVAIRSSNLPWLLVRTSQRCREQLVRLFPERDSNLFAASRTYAYQLWGKLGGFQTELLWHHTPDVEELNLLSLPKYNPLLRGTSDPSWAHVNTLYVSLSIGPVPNLSTISIPSLHQDAQGDQAILLCIKNTKIHDILEQFQAHPHTPLTRFSLKEGKVRATWCMDVTHDQHDIQTLMHEFMICLQPIFDITPEALPGLLAQIITNPDRPIASRERALTVLLERFPQNHQAKQCAKHPSSRTLALVSLLKAPHLYKHARPHALLNWGARTHPNMHTRKECLIRLLNTSKQLQHAHTIGTLEHVALMDQDPTLRALAITHALKHPNAHSIDQAALILVGKRILVHNKLATSSKQQLERAMLHHGITPSFETYTRLAKQTPDKILRYSSLRTLMELFPQDLRTLELMLQRILHEPVSWIASWCVQQLDDFEQHGWRDTLEGILKRPRLHPHLKLLILSRLPHFAPKTLSLTLARATTHRTFTMAITHLTSRYPSAQVHTILHRALIASEHKQRASFLGALLVLKQPSWLIAFTCARLNKLSADQLCELITHIKDQPVHTHKRLEPVLISMLHSKHARTRTLIVTTVGQIGSHASIHELKQLMHHTPSLRHEALRAITLITTRHKNPNRTRAHASKGQLTLISSQDTQGAISISSTQGTLELLDP